MWCCDILCLSSFSIFSFYQNHTPFLLYSFSIFNLLTLIFIVVSGFLIFLIFLGFSTAEVPSILNLYHGNFWLLILFFFHSCSRDWFWLCCSWLLVFLEFALCFWLISFFLFDVLKIPIRDHFRGFSRFVLAFWFLVILVKFCGFKSRHCICSFRPMKIALWFLLNVVMHNNFIQLGCLHCCHEQ